MSLLMFHTGIDSICYPGGKIMSQTLAAVKINPSGMNSQWSFSAIARLIKMVSPLGHRGSVVEGIYGKLAHSLLVCWTGNQDTALWHSPCLSYPKTPSTVWFCRFYLNHTENVQTQMPLNHKKSTAATQRYFFLLDKHFCWGVETVNFSAFTYILFCVHV